MTRTTISSAALLTIALTSLATDRVRADVVVLENGGRIEGALLDAKKSPRDKYIVETASGRLTFDKSQVKEVIGQSTSQEEYEKVRSQFPDTVEGQMALAGWCRDHHLTAQRQKHLERVLEIDPNFNEAHRLLRHTRDGGAWKTQRQYWEDQGYVEYLGQWMTPQEMELKEAARKVELAEKEWKRRIKTWRNWLEGPRANEALEQIGRIDDPFATRALSDFLDNEKVEAYRKRYVEALARIGTPVAMMILCLRSLNDPSEEIRLTALEYVTEKPLPAFTDLFIGRLRDKENATINRAAMALGRLKDRKAIGPLIEALVTDHIQQVAPAQPGTTAGFGSFNGGPASGGFSFGNSGPKTIKVTLKNPEVLEALVRLSGGLNFDFDRDAWKAWYASRKKSLSLNARRDED
ncbi:MAG TPA: HEAT repeat domain-containing protein [Pirellulales bacterium]|nr:HEAT repeat domain-containing protein [Pirellulales bacterium]